jgi:hypothetical protein
MRLPYSRATRPRSFTLQRSWRSVSTAPIGASSSCNARFRPAKDVIDWQGNAQPRFRLVCLQHDAKCSKEPACERVPEYIGVANHETRWDHRGIYAEYAAFRLFTSATLFPLRSNFETNCAKDALVRK